MQKLSDILSIETWETLTQFINSLSFEENSNKEFYQNILMLCDFIKTSHLPLDLKTGKREPTKKEDIGLATLLHHIYHIQPNAKQKENHIISPSTIFYENIQSLKNIGVKNIQFILDDTPILESVRISQCRCLHYYHDTEVVKHYTDGAFSIAPGSFSSSYEMQNFHDANYYLEEYLYLRKWTLYIGHLCAYVKNFNGTYPNIEEIMSLRLPMLQQNNVSTIWKETEEEVKQYYKTY